MQQEKTVEEKKRVPLETKLHQRATQKLIYTRLTVDGFSPPGAPAVVQRHRGGAPAGVPNRVVDCHVGAKLGAVLNVRGLPPRAVRSAHVVVVAAQDYRSSKRAVANGLVESKGNLDAGFGVGVCFFGGVEGIAVCL